MLKERYGDEPRIDDMPFGLISDVEEFGRGSDDNKKLAVSEQG